MVGRGIGGESLAGSTAGVEDGGVVTSAELAADCGQGVVGELAGEVDGQVPGPGEALGARAGDELVAGDGEVGADGVLDGGDARGAGGLAAQPEAVDDLLGEGGGEAPTGE